MTEAQTGTIYRETGTSNTVEVIDTRSDRVTYREITGWNYGQPSFYGSRHSTSTKRFAAEYEEVDFSLL